MDTHITIRGERLNKQTADDMIDKAVKKAIREYAKQEKMERRKKALHNTKLLLKNYNKIKSSIEEAISEANQLEAYTDEEEVYINSIRKSKLRSLIVISHIEKALILTKDEYDLKDMPYKYDALYDCLVKGTTFEEEAEALTTSAVTVRRWVNEVTKAVSIRIFGSDGIEII
ncbi:MAG: hypothetical protein K0R92_1533 [Lachnospiraceae bacterium]|nr:hypothetical protein [Lachnospiraceae bacterium]